MQEEILEHFLTNDGLYEKIAFNIDDFDSLIVFLQGKINIDIFCPDCKDKRIFNCVRRKVKVPPDPQQGRVFLPGLDEEIYRCIMAQNKREAEERFQKFVNDNIISSLTYICSKNKAHIMTFVVMLENGFMFKIGQYPSYADIDLPQTEKYRNTLGKDYYSEFKRAIGLYSCNVGIGAFVYLRRIIERLVNNAFEEAKTSGKLSDEEFEFQADGTHRNGIVEKIKLLKGFLPDLMTNNAGIYSIVSKGIHQLSEQECLEYFPAIESGIRMILDDRVYKKEKLEQEKSFHKSVNVITSKLKE